jgi:hypothetical protein
MQTFDLNPHQHLLEQQLPAWARHSAPEHWQALRAGLTPAQGLPHTQADWFVNALPPLREAVLASQARLRHSQRALGLALKGLRQITEFCEPLLQAGLAQHGLGASVRKAELLRVERTWSWLGTRFLYSSERHSLLQAALLNFADDVQMDRHSAVALGEHIVVQSTSVTGHAPMGYQGPSGSFQMRSQTYQVTPLAMTPEQFAGLCRELDLGQQYQAHLHEVFQGESQRAVRQQALRVQRDRLGLAADLARLQNTITGQAHATLQALLASGVGRCWQLRLFDIALHEVSVIDTADSGVLLYLPGHEPALRTCADLDAVHEALVELLQNPQQRQTFLGYIQLDQRAQWLDRLHQNLGPRPDLHLTHHAIGAELFEHLYDEQVARLKQEALVLAVPTAQADEQARKRRLQTWQALGLDALMLASFFIPAVGTLMLGVTACQLLDEAYEGYEAWSIGDQHAALGHLEAIGLNLAVIGGLHVAGKVVPKVLGSPLMERLEPLRKADGSRRLWRPDLDAYRHPAPLPESLKANAAGQWIHDAEHFIRLDGQYYAQRLDPSLGRWRITHPSDDQAYQPLLEHNGEGAWRAEHEQPQHWSLDTLLRRLGPAFDGFDDEQLRLAAHLCGLDENRLRQIHVQGHPAPPLLLDSLQRLHAEQATLAQLEHAPQLDHDTLFQQHYDPDTGPDPIGERLRQLYPHLQRPLARRLAMRVSADEVPRWAEAEQLPRWLEQAARQVTEALPLTRAIEGLWVPRLVNTDSERLLWACLPRLAQWPGELSLQLRAGSPQGPLLQALGQAEARNYAVVFKTEAGYEAHVGERPAPATVDHDLCRAVLEAVPAPLRQRLGNTDSLRQALHSLIGEDRPRYERLLRQTPAPRWNGGGLRGGDNTGIYPRLTLAGSLRGRYQRLYPSANDDMFNTSLARWRRQARSAEIELTRLEERLRQLRSDLASWADGAPHRRRAINPIISAWRRDSYNRLSEDLRVHTLNLAALELDSDDLASLVLPDDFHHIEELELSGNHQLDTLHPAFIGRFAHLRRLHLRDCRFAQIPDLPVPLRLTALDLQNNRITWDAAAQVRLNRSPNLIYLDLADNPLLDAPDLGDMLELQFVQLANASLTHLPEGLFALEQLEVLDLSDNQLLALPPDLALPEQVGRAMQLESDWLSAPTHQQIDDYYQRYGIDLLVSDHDYSDLLDEADEQQRAVWQRLPLAYRRGLRAILVDDLFLDDPETMLPELWRRLLRMDREPVMRDYALSQAPWRLLQLPM